MRDLGIAILREVGVDTGGCNIQFAVDPARRPAHRHRDEPAGVAVECAGVQGDRLPDREDRREAGHRLHARRDRQRHHQGDAGLLRADARLRRGQGAAVRVREVPRRRPDADHHDEVGRRGDVVGPQLHRGARQGDAVAGDRARRVLDRARSRRHGRRTAGRGCGRRPTAGSTTSSWRCGSAPSVERGRRGLGCRPVVRRADRRPGRAAGRTARRARCSTRSCCAAPSTAGCRTARSPRCDRNSPARSGCGRCGSGSASTRSTRPSTPARPSSRPRRRTTTAATSSIPPPRPRSPRSPSGPRC